MYKIVSLGEIANVTTGFPFKGNLYSDEGTRVVRGENVTVGSLRWDSTKCWNSKFEQTEKYSLKEDDVVIGMDGSRVGKNRAQVKARDLPLLLAQRVACIRSTELTDQNYLYYLIRSEKFEQYVNKIQTGSSIPHISLKQIEEFPVAFPPLATQRRIASVLSSLDSKIELNNRINTELEAMAKTLYDYWFVQFDFPDKNGKPYKSSGGKMVWNEELKRELPEGWEVTTIDDYAEIKKGDLITAKDAKKGSIKVIAAGIDYSYFHSTPNRFKNTITISGSGANAGYINFWREPIFASDCITVRGKSDAETLLLLQYLYFIQPHILNQATGSAQPHVYPSDIKVLNYVVPRSQLIEKYGDAIIPMNEKIGNNLKENQKLTELRDWLLPMLMNGQVKVSEL